MSIIKQREPANSISNLASPLHPVIERIYGARGITDAAELERGLTALLPYQDLANIDAATDILYAALKLQQRILIVGDYDADGATSTALAVRALKAFGAKHVNYLVPNRFTYGYGLSPAIVELAAEKQPDLIMTVDNGIASIDGVQAANDLNIKVLVTDHHLQGEKLPEAAAIVNPNQKCDSFKSKALAGVGVCFYVMLALRAKLRAENWFSEQGIDEPNMASFLDLVALGTVADVVPLDHNNRILVYQGLRRIRAGKCIPGITALLQVGKRSLFKLTAQDLGFAIGPRLNAAGRLDDMSLGIECLLSEDKNQAQEYAQDLNNLNLERRDIEQEMKQQALQNLQQLNLDATQLPRGLCLYQADWHQGVIGILASRIKDQYHRPVIIFADAGNGELKGSARSVKGVHIRDVLDAIATKHPNMITKFGGHAMAAGLSINAQYLQAFSKAFADEVALYLKTEDLHGEILSDGSLDYQDVSLKFAEVIQEAGPFGQAFPEPLFDDEFEIIEQRIVGQNHLRLSLKHPRGDKIFNAIKFNIDLNQWPQYRCQRVHVAYKLDINEYNDLRSVQLLIEEIKEIPG